MVGQISSSDHEQLMRHVEKLAADSEPDNGVKAAAILVKNGNIVASGSDRTIRLNDPIAVAVAQCYRDAGRRNDQSELDLYCSPAPDMLAAGIIIQFGVGTLYVREQIEDCAVLTFLDKHHTPIVSLPT